MHLNFYLSLLFIMQFSYVELNFPCRSQLASQLAKRGDQESGNSMTKEVREKRESAQKL